MTLAKGDVGLSNVDNTSDANKPISNATQAALNDKQSKITANGILKGDGSGNITAANETEVELVSLPNICNPNILDNGNFQVWQRYPEGTYTGVPYKEYIADRWRFLSSDGSVTNTITKAGYYGIKNASGPNMRVNQRLENAAQYNGKPLTLSLLRGDGSLSYNTVVASGWTETTDVFSFFGAELSWLHTGETWLAVKLELGTQQTLAHQENGVWVLNEIPDYGEQLRRCQRYCRVYPANKAMPCIAYPETDGWYLDAALWVGDMRTAPTNNLGDGIACKVQYIDGGDSYDMTATNWGLLRSGMQVLRLASTQLPSDKRKFPYIVVPQVNLVLSADL